MRASEPFECLNLLGFQLQLVRTSVLALRPDNFFLFGRTQNGRGKMSAKCRVPMGYKSIKFVVGKLDLVKCRGHQGHQKSLLGQNLYSKRVWQNGRQSSKLVTAVWVPKRPRILTTFGTHVWPVSMPKSFLLFVRTQNGRGKMAAKRQIPMGYKSSKFVVGKRDSVDL